MSPSHQQFAGLSSRLALLLCLTVLSSAVTSSHPRQAPALKHISNKPRVGGLMRNASREGTPPQGPE